MPGNKETRQISHSTHTLQNMQGESEGLPHGTVAQVLPRAVRRVEELQETYPTTPRPRSRVTVALSVHEYQGKKEKRIQQQQISRESSRRLIACLLIMCIVILLSWMSTACQGTPRTGCSYCQNKLEGACE
jgi:hypothetical protein